MIVVPGAEAALDEIEAQANLALSQRRTILIAKHGQEHLAGESGSLSLPIDVEEIGVRREPAPFQHVEPPEIVLAAHSHVVRHEVEHQTHAAPGQAIGKVGQLLERADFRIDGIVIDDVVAVGRPGPRLQEGRGVDVADAEIGEVVDERAGIGEGEGAIELEAICRPRRRAHGLFLASSSARASAARSASCMISSSARVSFRRQLGC